MKLSHVIVAIVFFLLGAAAVFAYVYYGSFCLGDKPLVGIITEPRNVAEAPGAPKSAVPAAKPLSSVVSSVPTMSFRIEQNVNRHGSDYRDFEMAAKDDVALCQKACADDAKCLAFTFVKAGIQGTAPHCWLKNTVPQAYPDTTCVSGVKD